MNYLKFLQHVTKKILILYEESGHTELYLEDFMTTNYSWGEIGFVSDTDCTLENLKIVMLMEESIDIRPDHIDLRDSATFVWEIG